MSPTTMIILFTTAAFLCVCGAVWLMLGHYFSKIQSAISVFLAQEEARENDLRHRERLVMAAALEGELIANRTKLEAFVTIYQEMMRNFKEPSKAPKYIQGGEIIHDRPSLSGTMFKTYADRLPLLGPDIARELARIYAEVESAPAYKTLGTDLNVDQAIHVIERIVEQAKALLTPTESIIAALSVIIRDKKKFH